MGISNLFISANAGANRISKQGIDFLCNTAMSSCGCISTYNLKRRKNEDKYMELILSFPRISQQQKAEQQKFYYQRPIASDMRGIGVI
jgi:hypothetical protein